MVFFSGCTNKSAMLVKTWKVSDAKCLQQIPAGMQPAIDNWRNEMKNNFTITYRADGTYESHMNQNVIKGKWKLNWNSSAIKVENETGDSKNSDIIELSANKYTFKEEAGKQEFIFEMIPVK